MAEQRGPQSIDVGELLGRVRRLARFDTHIFEEVRDDPAQTVPALLVVVAAVFLSGIGGWLWLVVEDFPGLSTSKVLVKEVLLGTLWTVLLWAVWVVVADAVLAQLSGARTNRQALIRTMGFAAAPGAMALLMLIPSVSLGVGVVALVAWFSFSNYALQAVAPQAQPSQIVIANGAGFLVFAVVLALLADSVSQAPGVFVYGADRGEYLKGFDFNLN